MNNPCAISGSRVFCSMMRLNGNTVGQRVCSVEGCDKEHCAKGFCDRHYFASDHFREINRRGKQRRETGNPDYQAYRRKKYDCPKAKLRHKAKYAVRAAIARGEITRKRCEVCNAEKTHAHHDNYNEEFWLIVRWLCPKHHMQWHQKNTPIEHHSLLLPS